MVCFALGGLLFLFIKDSSNSKNQTDISKEIPRSEGNYKYLRLGNQIYKAPATSTLYRGRERSPLDWEYFSVMNRLAWQDRDNTITNVTSFRASFYTFEKFLNKTLLDRRYVLENYDRPYERIASIYINKNRGFDNLIGSYQYYIDKGYIEEGKQYPNYMDNEDIQVHQPNPGQWIYIYNNKNKNIQHEKLAVMCRGVTSTTCGGSIATKGYVSIGFKDLFTRDVSPLYFQEFYDALYEIASETHVGNIEYFE